MHASTYKLPIPTNATKDRVHGFAEEVAEKLAFAPGDPIEPLVGRLGGQIEYKNALDFKSSIPESIKIDPSRRFKIFLPSMGSSPRYRFTIAHELGHLFLHFPMVSERDPNAGMIATRWVDDNDTEPLKRAEWEANWFAAAFLMPSAPFRSMLAAFGGNIASVATRFGVSVQAAEIRAKTLGGP
ncbi:ImmA/IrrE family metallo-endopeptidase [Bradyrhizobium sp. 1]|uniref:ImmA/IrrE family metallo-endopeptidase n=1 Tax=Bradyrhizobium sp. 1 TaxID=241591 RepID=UPI001FF90A2C|nr:ImmA/IrrE family metallo-endopeptidase [Bradyrhizobium sp. 1]MCK1393384.1 ImmA/IrrE family metallo-endopeptidase [Bradyrhizobium sp. 1]